MTSTWACSPTGTQPPGWLSMVASGLQAMHARLHIALMYTSTVLQHLAAPSLCQRHLAPHQQVLYNGVHPNHICPTKRHRWPAWCCKRYPMHDGLHLCCCLKGLARISIAAQAASRAVVDCVNAQRKRTRSPEAATSSCAGEHTYLQGVA
jgi:hypothetical protein